MRGRSRSRSSSSSAHPIVPKYRESLRFKFTSALLLGFLSFEVLRRGMALLIPRFGLAQDFPLYATWLEIALSLLVAAVVAYIFSNLVARWMTDRLVRFAQSHLNVGQEYRGLTLWWKENGVRVVSPMLIVIVALGATDIMFALDSIPAIFGITQEPYLVFTANVFALMGLRQLYFLLGGLLKRLVYLSLGLAFILAWIGGKLIIHAMYKGGVIDWEVPTLLSLAVILVTLAVTAVASLVKSSKDDVEVVATDSVPPAPAPKD